MTEKAEALDPEAPVSVIATATGALPIKGLVQPGEAFDVPLMGFSATWMKPANASAAKMVNAWRQAQAPNKT